MGKKKKKRKKLMWALESIKSDLSPFFSIMALLNILYVGLYLFPREYVMLFVLLPKQTNYVITYSIVFFFLSFLDVLIKRTERKKGVLFFIQYLVLIRSIIMFDIPMILISIIILIGLWDWKNWKYIAKPLLKRFVIVLLIFAAISVLLFLSIYVNV